MPSSVDGEDAVEFFRCYFGDVPECLDAGIGDHDVDVLEVCVGFFEEGHDVRGLRDVGCDCDGGAAEGFDFFDDLLRACQYCLQER